MEGTESLAIRGGVREGHHESYRYLVPDCDCVSLQLGGPKLCLEVHRGAFDLDVDELPWPAQQQIGGAQVPRSNRHLELHPPSRAGGGHDEMRQPQLTGVAERDGGHRVETPAELVPTGGRQAAARRQ